MSKHLLSALIFCSAVPPVQAQSIEPVDVYEDYEPIWSADGRRIFYTSSIGNHPTQNVFSMDVSGGGVTQLTFSNTGYGNGFPSPSPNGRHVAYVHEEEGNRDIYLMNVDGTNVRRLTDQPSWDGERVGWAPDGKSFVFHSDRHGNLELYRLELETGEVARLTDHDATDRWASFSPDGEDLVFESARDGNAEIYLMNLRDSSITRLTEHWADDGGPSWHPNGKDVYFYSNRDDVNYDIYAVDVETKLVSRVTNSHNWDLDASISPDGSRMVWHSSRNGHYGITLANTDATHRQRLTNTAQSDFYRLAARHGWESAVAALHEAQAKASAADFYLDEELVDLMHFLVSAERPGEALAVARYLTERGAYKGYAYTRMSELLVRLGGAAPPTQSRFFDLLANDEFDAAVAAYERSKELDPDWLLFEDWEQFILLQIAWNRYFKNGEFEKAIRIYEMALSYYPDSHAAYHDMANGYLKLGNTALGLKNHNKAAELDPDGWYGRDSKRIVESLPVR